VLHTVKERTGSLIAASKEFGLEVNADKTKYMVMSRDQNAGQSHNMKIDYSSVERVEEFRYLGKTLTNQNLNQEEIKSRLTVCLLSFRTESFVVQFVIQKYKDK